jgi:hypothetical protein
MNFQNNHHSMMRHEGERILDPPPQNTLNTKHTKSLSLRQREERRRKALLATCALLDGEDTQFYCLVCKSAIRLHLGPSYCRSNFDVHCTMSSLKHQRNEAAWVANYYLSEAVTDG